MTGIPIGMMNFDRSSTRHDEYQKWLREVKNLCSDEADDIVCELRENLGHHFYRGSCERRSRREMRIFG